MCTLKGLGGVVFWWCCRHNPEIFPLMLMRGGEPCSYAWEMGSRDPHLHERKLYVSKQQEKTLIIPSNLDRFDVSQELGDNLGTSHIRSWCHVKKDVLV